MSFTPILLRGAVLRVWFPYVDAPHLRGAKMRYCLAIPLPDVSVSLLAVCYGTSKLDAALLAKHNGAILSVASEFVRGKMPGIVTHFVADHVALCSPSWVDWDFQARLDFMRPSRRTGDARREKLYASFAALEPIMQAAAVESFNAFMATGRPGLPDWAKLR